jgi:hypothetical protein
MTTRRGWSGASMVQAAVAWAGYQGHNATLEHWD